MPHRDTSPPSTRQEGAKRVATIPEAGPWEDMTAKPHITGEVIDLAAIARPLERVMEIFDRLSRGQVPVPGSLDDALAALDDGPRPPGQLGDDIAVLVSGGAGHSRSEVLAAVDRLRRISLLQSEPPVAAVPQPRRPQPKRAATPGQLEIPGLGDHGIETS